MAYVIFEMKAQDAGKISKLLTDDIVSRQSISIRESKSLDLKGDCSYIKIEGSQEGLKKAEEIAKEAGFKKLDAKKAKKIDEKIKEQEDSAASGIGMIFD